MLLMLNNPQTDNPLSNKWADSAVGDLLAGIKLNLRLVKDGIYDQLIIDMKTEAEVEAYGVFLTGLRDSIKLAKKIRGF